MYKIDLVLQGKCDNYTYEIALHYLKLDFVNRIIVSCWENDIDIPANENIIQIKSKDIDNPGIVNRNRQIKTSLEGLKLVETEFSVKLRSDQKISIGSMHLMNAFYNRHKDQEISFIDGGRPKNKICVAGMFRNYPFHPRDHIFWGNTSDLIDVFTIPYDDVSQNEDWSQSIRAEIYISMFYYAKFDSEVAEFIKESTKYFVDFAPNIDRALVKSNELGAKIFKPFPKIDMDFPKKYGSSPYPYYLAATCDGEYWSENE